MTIHLVHYFRHAMNLGRADIMMESICTCKLSIYLAGFESTTRNAKRIVHIHNRAQFLFSTIKKLNVKCWIKIKHEKYSYLHIYHLFPQSQQSMNMYSYLQYCHISARKYSRYSHIRQYLWKYPNNIFFY
jgi:hypothetical protein